MNFVVVFKTRKVFSIGGAFVNAISELLDASMQNITSKFYQKGH